ncbi:MAG: hypothetical protein KJ804_14080 [Proteobacteria bacterium]|nr:hypothetical protein [Pseudomonadota bacterium]
MKKHSALEGTTPKNRLSTTTHQRELQALLKEARLSSEHPLSPSQASRRGQHSPVRRKDNDVPLQQKQ